MSRNAWLWLLWITATLVAGSALAGMLLVSGDRTTLLVGETTGVHHQFEVACETCHAAAPFEDVKKATKALNKTCRTCHDEELAASNDSHPRKKFRSPRMADYWERVDVRFCTSCHIEHRPEITRPGAVTLAMDYCVACHSEGERDVRRNRESHAGLEFDTCATAGCHNFHDNRALYEDFLVKHGGKPWLADEPVHGLTATLRAEPPPPPEKALLLGDALAPAAAMADQTAVSGWAASAHAAGGVNCAACHAPKVAKTDDLAKIETEWSAAPDAELCTKCHRAEAKTYRIGRHGMRSHPNIAKPRKVAKQLRKLGLDDIIPASLVAWVEDATPPAQMTVAEARVPMHEDAEHLALGCSSCHGAHALNTRRAQVEACAGCHADEHTAAYFQSPHYALWQAELAGEGAPGSGVTCATCHLPKVEQGRKIVTNHNQNDVLRPNEKMIRPVCMDCHGLSFAIDALADPALVARNFQGRPTAHISSVDWAMRRVKTDGQGANR